MKIYRFFSIIFTVLSILQYTVSAQEIKTDSASIISKDSLTAQQSKEYNLNYKKLIIPGVLIGYGVASLTIDGLKQLNLSTRYEISEHKPNHIKLDNYTQYAPAVLVYGLNLAGIEGKHNLKDRTIIYVTSQMISAAMVLPLKSLTREERPDGSNHQSFPSGHTDAAFSSAQFMFREYKDTNFWLSISGYPIAVFTGVYRALNNKHWVGDIVAGAGFGILSTEMAYWLYPKINKWIFKNKENSQTIISPYYQDKAVGFALVKRF